MSTVDILSLLDKKQKKTMRLKDVYEHVQTIKDFIGAYTEHEINVVVKKAKKVLKKMAMM